MLVQKTRGARHDDGMRDDTFLAVMRLRIRKARLARHLKQEEVAERTHLPLRSYQRFEARDEKRPFNPTLFSLLAVARAIGVDLGEFVREPEEEEIRALEAEGRPRRVR